jgi:hypothetical protein
MFVDKIANSLRAEYSACLHNADENAYLGADGDDSPVMRCPTFAAYHFIVTESRWLYGDNGGYGQL